MRATKAYINLDNLRENIACVKSFIKEDVKMCIAVKADGYGHGAARTAIAAIQAGASVLAVASVQEGIELREAGIVAPILTLSLPLKEEIPSIIVHSITPLVFDEEFIEQVNEVAESMHRRVPVYLKIDTGMGRVGCRPEKAGELAEKISTSNGLYLEGCITHFAVSDSVAPENMEYTAFQVANFNKAIAQIKEKGIDPGICSASSSGGIFLHPEAHFDMVRPGIVVYGYYPDPALKEVLALKRGESVVLKPVMEVVTHVVAIKHFYKGESISYGRTWVAEEDCDVAVLPIGYADGLVRKLSPGLTVTIDGKQYPVVGRICMDQCMVCLGSKHNVKRWDKVTVFGYEEGCKTADDLAAAAGTISYEILCGINKRVPRVFIDNEKNY
ncbi:MAG: alanine racemase [Treponema sp.]|nr:alanine racemase [Candidatus Treponema caballi]